MEAKKTGISRDLIIHPGETIADILKEREMTQAELAARTGLTPAYISKVISGEKDISASFAQALEYALSVPKTFWLNLQAHYDAEILEYEKEHTITDEERKVRAYLKDIVKYLRERRVIPDRESVNDSIISLRKFFQVSSLVNLKNIIPAGYFRLSHSAAIDPYVMGAWLRLCEMSASSKRIETSFDKSKVNCLVSELKEIMTGTQDNVILSIREAVEKYGIDFSVAHNFRGAPVHGYISKKKDGNYHMVVTIRGAFADIFWFSIFHELGHIVNGDVKKAKDLLIPVWIRRSKAGPISLQVIVCLMRKIILIFLRKVHLTSVRSAIFPKSRT